MRHKSNDKRLNEPSVLILVFFFTRSVIAVAAAASTERNVYLFIFLRFFLLFDEIQWKCECLNLETRYDSKKSMSNRNRDCSTSNFSVKWNVLVWVMHKTHTPHHTPSLEWTSINFSKFHPFSIKFSSFKSIKSCWKVRLFMDCWKNPKMSACLL